VSQFIKILLCQDKVRAHSTVLQPCIKQIASFEFYLKIVSLF